MVLAPPQTFHWVAKRKLFDRSAGLLGPRVGILHKDWLVWSLLWFLINTSVVRLVRLVFLRVLARLQNLRVFSAPHTSWHSDTIPGRAMYILRLFGFAVMRFCGFLVSRCSSPGGTNIYYNVCYLINAKRHPLILKDIMWTIMHMVRNVQIHPVMHKEILWHMKTSIKQYEQSYE